jgi:hypothetical protein
MAPVRADTARAAADMFIPKPFDLQILALQVSYLAAAARALRLHHVI